ncbi:MAG: hypothetical protein IKY18_06520 [Oscillospiraceae bacterium]|nr:hypothetical protein [Oscillospiraceae bacterium]
MFSRITNKFKANPMLYYALSIAASWAGVGSLMNSVTMTQTYGIVPSILWSLGNSLACMLFGIIACKLTTLRSLMRTKGMKYAIGIMSIFQLWINMNGIREVFSDTPIGAVGGTIIVYAVCIGFIIALLKFGMIRNVLTDGFSWIAVYVLVAIVTAAAFITTGDLNTGIGLGLEPANMEVGWVKGLLLLPGPFTFPYFFELLDYNDVNQDATKKCNIKRSFILGGALFGFYMIFTFALAFVQFTPWLNLLKAILVSIIGISTISTFIYSEYIVFGRKLGLAIDITAVVFWPLFISLGVMGVWTLMAELRVYLVIAMLLIALVQWVKQKGVRS